MKRKNTISVRRVIIVVCTVMSESIYCLAGHRWEVKGPYHYLLIGQSQSVPVAQQPYNPDEQRACHQGDVTASGNDEAQLRFALSPDSWKLDSCMTKMRVITANTDI